MWATEIYHASEKASPNMMAVGSGQRELGSVLVVASTPLSGMCWSHHSALRCTLRDSSPSATRSNRHEPLAGWCTVVRTNAGVLGSVSALAYPPATRPEQWFAHGSRLLILLFFFQSLRASRGNELLHTLTLGQALMPAGLPFERRIMRHACGPRRAWLKNH